MKFKQKLWLAVLLLVTSLVIYNCTNTPTTPNQNEKVTTQSTSEKPLAFSTTLPQDNTAKTFYEVLANGDTMYFIPRDSTVTKTVTTSLSLTTKVWDSVRHVFNSPSNPPPPPPPPPPPSGYVLIYQNDISIGTGGASKLGDLDPFNHGQIGGGSFDNVTYVSAPGSFRDRPTNVSAGTRSEIQFEAAQTPLEGAVEFDVRFNTFVWQNGHWLQWHPSTSGGSGAPRLQFDGNGVVDIVNWNNANAGNKYYSTSFSPVTGQWYHVRFEYKFGTNGYMNFIVDGVTKASVSGVQVGDGSTPYLKVGYNGWDGNSSKFDANYDNIKVYKKTASPTTAVFNMNPIKNAA